MQYNMVMYIKVNENGQSVYIGSTLCPPKRKTVKERNQEGSLCPLLHSGALTIVPTFKGVGLYGATFLHVGTMVNAPLCNSFYLFLSFLCHPYILTILEEKFYYF